ncbi:MAG: hypothetical protein OWQ59_03340, partial [Alicyclobacillaceae bacterium]|nr:hypothetical protein [Alicyclobacillaceae bacterium]
QTTWLDVSIASPEQTEWLVEQFNKERAEEYTEVVATCGGFTFDSTVPECEARIGQLEKMLRKIVARDYFQCRTRTAAELAVTDMKGQLLKQSLYCAQEEFSRE